MAIQSRLESCADIVRKRRFGKMGLMESRKEPAEEEVDAGGGQSRCEARREGARARDVLKESPGAGAAGEAGVQGRDGGDGAHPLEGEQPVGEWAGGTWAEEGTRSTCARGAGALDGHGGLRDRGNRARCRTSCVHWTQLHSGDGRSQEH